MYLRPPVVPHNRHIFQLHEGGRATYGLAFVPVLLQLDLDIAILAIRDLYQVDSELHYVDRLNLGSRSCVYRSPPLLHADIAVYAIYPPTRVSITQFGIS